MRLRKIFLLTNIIIVGLILWVGFTIYRTWASTQPGTYQPSVKSGKKAAGNRSPRKGVADISTFQSVIKADIFKTHKSMEGSRAQETSPAAVKETDLDLQLKGTMIDDAGERFAVILDGKSREQQTYAENDFVNGVRIERILADRVILDRKGTRESLLMSYESGPAAVQRALGKRTPPRKVIRAPSLKKKINVRRRPPVRKVPSDEEGADGP